MEGSTADRHGSAGGAHVEQEVQHVAVLDHVLLAFGAHLARFLGAGLALVLDEVVDKYRHSATHIKALEWLEKLGPKACLLAWLPAVGDPLCAVAGWLKLPFWPCVAYMAIGKLARYTIMTASLLWVFPGQLPMIG